MLTGLLRLLLILGAFFLLRRILGGLFQRSRSKETMRNPHPRRESRDRSPHDEKASGPQQPIEEADYEDLD